MRLLERSIPNAIVGRVRQANRGQAIILIALLFIALIAFVGIVVDVGTVLTRYAQLRGAVDAAAVQASNQFRESRALFNSNGDGVSLGKDMYSSAAQVYAAHGFDPKNLRLYACENSGYPDEIASHYNDIEAVNPNGDPIADPEFLNTSSPPIGDDPTEGEELTALNTRLRDQLCSKEGEDPRKLVRVDGRLDVGLPFLSVVGWKHLTVRATSVGEAAAIDLVLVLDRSRSMARESGGFMASGCATHVPPDCQPFEDVRSSAKLLIDRLYFPYDRVSIIEFDRYAWVWDTEVPTFTTDTSVIKPSFVIAGSGAKTTATDVLDNYFSMQAECQKMPGIECANCCVATNIGGAIKTATRILAVQGRRRASVWMMVLLTDGAPNATDIGSEYAPFYDGFCPPNSWPNDAQLTQVFTVTGYTPVITTSVAPYAVPLCLSLNYDYGTQTDKAYSELRRTCWFTNTDKCGPGTTISSTAPGDTGVWFTYDAADFTRDQADYMAKNGVVAFVIGLGPYVSGVDDSGDPVALNPDWENGTNSPYRDVKAGQRLLRYIADMGYDPGATQNKLWPCHSDYWAGADELDYRTQCGNYWYAPKGEDLQGVFEEIASRMFTRLAQ